MTTTFVIFWNGHFHKAVEDREQANRMAQHLRDMGASKVSVERFDFEPREPQRALKRRRSPLKPGGVLRKFPPDCPRGA